MIMYPKQNDEDVHEIIDELNGYDIFEENGEICESEIVSIKPMELPYEVTDGMVGNK